MLRTMFFKKETPQAAPGIGVTHGDLGQLTYRKKFSDYLPWLAYDPESKLYVNGDDTVGFMWECPPLSFAGEKTIDTLEGLFRLGLPEDSVLQFILYADSEIDGWLKGYDRLKTRKDDLARKVVEKYTDHLEKGKDGLESTAGIPVRDFRLFITIKIPAVGKDLKSLSLTDTYNTIQEILTAASLNPSPLEPEALVDLMRKLLNDAVSDNRGVYDDDVEIKKQIIFADTVIRKDLSSMRVGEKVFRCTTPKSFPKETNFMQTNELFGGIWGIKSDTDQIKTPFLYCLNIIFQNLKPKLHTKCNMVLQQEAVGSFAPSLRRKQNEYLWAVDELEKGVRFFRVMPILWVFGKNEAAVGESIVRAKRMWESGGYVMQEDKGILPILFISSLPFGLYTNGNNVENIDRDFIAPAQTVASILPVQSDFSGGGMPVLLFTGRKGQVCSLDIFNKAGNASNLFVTASTGAGKSFFINFLSYNYYAANAIVRIIDIGGSYKKMTKMCNARYLDFNDRAEICLNPFTTMVSEEAQFELPIIADVVATMAYSSMVNSQPSQTERTIIKDAVNWAYEQEGNEAGVDTIYRYLNEYPAHTTDLEIDKMKCGDDITSIAHNLAFNLRDFISGGIYGRYFNGKSTFDISKDEFVVLELEHLKRQKELFRVVTLQVINEVTKDLYLSDRSRPRLIIFDEAWQFMKEGDIMREIIEEMYRRCRKYGASSAIITQSLLDLKAFGSVGDVIRLNSPYKFYLESTDFEKAKQENLLDYDEFTMMWLKSIKSNKPKYSEIFMETPFGFGVVRLAVDPFSYYVYTSSAEEISEIESMVDQGGMSYEQAIGEMAKKYRS